MRTSYTRVGMLHKDIPHDGCVCAEIGVLDGDFSAKILKICRPAKLHLIDPWVHQDPVAYKNDLAQRAQEVHDGKYQAVLTRFREQITAGQVVVHRGFSTAVAPSFPDQYFDWIYLDGNHSLEGVRADLEAFLPKMKPGGLITGHDFVNHRGYGVVQAVKEFCAAHDWSIVLITKEKSASFVIRDNSIPALMDRWHKEVTTDSHPPRKSPEMESTYKDENPWKYHHLAPENIRTAKTMLFLMPQKPASKIVELGCGEGYITECMLKVIASTPNLQAVKIHYVGVDISPTAVERWKANVSKWLVDHNLFNVVAEGVVADIERDESFYRTHASEATLIFECETLYYLDVPSRCLRLIAQYCPSGCIVGIANCSRIPATRIYYRDHMADKFELVKTERFFTWKALGKKLFRATAVYRKK